MTRVRLVECVGLGKWWREGLDKDSQLFIRLIEDCVFCMLMIRANSTKMAFHRYIYIIRKREKKREGLMVKIQLGFLCSALSHQCSHCLLHPAHTLPISLYPQTHMSSLSTHPPCASDPCYSALYCQTSRCGHGCVSTPHLCSPDAHAYSLHTFWVSKIK